MDNPCPQLFQLSAEKENVVEKCTELKYYDYFSGSELSFALTIGFLGLCTPATYLILYLLAKYQQRKKIKSRQKARVKIENLDVTEATEWVGKVSKYRHVLITFIKPHKKLKVTNAWGKTLRYIDLQYQSSIIIYLTNNKFQDTISIQFQGEVDLVLVFENVSEREDFLKKLEMFLREFLISHKIHYISKKALYSTASTKDKRQKVLDEFFRIICLKTFHTDKDAVGCLKLNSKMYKEILNCKLTQTEFSDALGMQATSMFVQNMFHLLDRENRGSLSFREFLDCFVILSSGDSEKKAKLMFDMYDIHHKGYLDRFEFSQMIRSLLELADATLEIPCVEELSDTMLTQIGKNKEENIVNFKDFRNIFIMNEYGHILQKATLGLQAAGVDSKLSTSDRSFASRRQTVFINDLRKKSCGTENRRISKVYVTTMPSPYHKGNIQQKLHEFSRFIENYQLQIFWMCLYLLLAAGIFIERSYKYSTEREHTGLRQIAGFGITVTRGAANTMMFTYSSILLTMCRNTNTFLRETFLNKYIPFDSSHTMHYFIAMLALLFTVVHCIGHFINFYHISTQSASDLSCLFREYYHPTHVLPTFHYWIFQTITGFTGVFALLVVIIMYVFSIQYSRQHVFQAFWFTHRFYIVFYILMFIHGMGLLIQEPLFFYFFVAPMVIYLIDKMITISRNKIEITVFKAELLPSDVICLVFKRPLNFEYRSGQWVRIACLELGKNEYHPFTLTSSPHEDILSLHICALGPWTTNLRWVYDTHNFPNKPYPKLYLDGPFGEGHQDWYKFQVSVLIGGGIGVTPFASILKDIVYTSYMDRKYICEKVYFLWVTRTQRHFEWFTDIIREVEDADTKEFVSVHIFITQFFQKFDLRTTMLYICERHFQKIANRSLFTGLKSITHFGRPQICDLLFSLQLEHPKVNRIGVFSCGPPQLINSVQKACTDLNKAEGAVYVHHFENF